MKKCCLILLLFSIMFAQSSYSQNAKRLDSLFTVLSKSNSDSVTCKTLLDLSLEYRFTNHLKSSEYNYQAKTLAVKTKNDKILLRTIINEGVLNAMSGKTEKAFTNLFDALSRAEKAGDVSAKSTVMTNLGTIYTNLEDYKNAEKYYLEALKIDGKFNKEASSVWAYSNLAYIYIKKEDYSNALKYLNQARRFKQSKEPNMSATIDCSTGECYLAMNRTNIAMMYFQKAKKTAEDNDLYYNYAQILNNTGLCYKKMGDIPSAIEDFNKSLEISLRNSIKELVYKNYLSLAECYESVGKTKDALRCYKKYMIYKDSVINETQNKKIIELNNKYTILSKQNEINAKDSKIQLNENKITGLALVIKILIAVGFTLLILFIVFIAVLKKLKLLNKSLAVKNTEVLQQNEKIKEITNNLEQQRDHLELVNQTKDKFFSIIAHDLKNPIGSFGQMTELLNDSFDKLTKEESKKIIKVLQNSAKYSFDLLTNLLEWSRSQTGAITFSPMFYNLHELVNSIVNIFEVQAANKDINIVNEVDPVSICYFDRNMITTVLRNLVSNAVKFTHNNGTVRIYSEENDHRSKICIEDNGVGIGSEMLYELFRIETKVTRKGTQNEIGTGLGLILCKEFVEKNNGSIGVESEENKGSKFWFTLSKKRQEK